MLAVWSEFAAAVRCLVLSGAWCLAAAAAAAAGGAGGGDPLPPDLPNVEPCRATLFASRRRPASTFMLEEFHFNVSHTHS